MVRLCKAQTGLIWCVALASGAAGAADAPEHPHAIIDTSLGAIEVELFADEAPETVANFIELAEGRKQFTDPRTGMPAKRPYYDGLTFHRVIKHFMIQGGDPLGTGSGGPGFTIKDEINAHSLGLDGEKVLVGENLNDQCAYMANDFMRVEIQPKMKAHGITDATPPEDRKKTGAQVLEEIKTVTLQQFYTDLGYTYDQNLPASHKPMRGCLAMANSGPNTNGSQFFINLGDTPHLTGKHTVFGQVVNGLETLDAIGNVATAQGDKPVAAVVIKTIRLVPPPKP